MIQRFARLTALILIMSLTTFLSAATWSAQPAEPNRPDFSTSLLFRTYSPGLSLNPQVGYAQSIWGDPKTPWHGFIRPYVIGVISPTLYEGKPGIEIFPISILGVDIKRAFSRRFTTTRGQDCDLLQCTGDLNYTDLSFQTYLGYADYFTSVRWTRTFFDAVADRTRPVYEVGTSVLIDPNGDSADFVTVAAGKTLNEKMSAGILLQVADFHSAGNHQDGQYAFLKTSCDRPGFEDLTAMIGLGRYYSSRNIAEFSAILSINYTPIKAIGYGR